VPEFSNGEDGDGLIMRPFDEGDPCTSPPHSV
jgi:hypothetical protein